MSASEWIGWCGLFLASVALGVLFGHHVREEKRRREAEREQRPILRVVLRSVSCTCPTCASMRLAMPARKEWRS